MALFDRFRSAYEGRDAVAYSTLFTPDFRFYFGDAEGRAAHPQGWGKDDEVASARHLFEGFVNAAGRALPAASRIGLDFGSLDVRPDPEHPCDREHYALVDAPGVVLRIAFDGGGEVVTQGHHAFWIVRPADGGQGTAAWSVRRWVEEPAGELVAAACADSNSAASRVAAASADGPGRLWTIAPNPSRGGESARLAFEVPRTGTVVDATLFDVAGRRILTLARGPRAAGRGVLVWDGRDDRGAPSGAGIYFLRMRVGDRVRQARVVRIP